MPAHPANRPLALAAALTMLMLPSRASADAEITVNANAGDWSGTTTCFSEPSGDHSGNIDLNRACLENNNRPGNQGYLFGLFETASNLPNADVMFGVAIDVNLDGALTASDDVFVAFFPRGSNTATELRVYDPVGFTLKRTYTSTTNCGGPTGSRDWSAAKSNRVVEFGLAYGCLGMSHNNDTRLMQMGAYPSSDLTTTSFYDGTASTLLPAGPPPVPTTVTAVARNGTATLAWTNPAQHEGTLIVRAEGVAPGTDPLKGVSYTAGQALGNGVVVYADRGGSTAAAFTDDGLVNGTRYFYKVYNHHQLFTYSLAAPSSSGLLVIPTSQAAAEPQWCYSTGFAMLMQPVTELGVGIFHTGNNGAVGANLTTVSNPSTDGGERYRPVPLQAAVQSRFPIVPLANGTRAILTGDQQGYTYAINADTGARLWGGTGGVRVGTSIQAQPAVQLNQYADTAFKAANLNRDLVFFVARESASPRVVALSSTTGATVWTVPTNPSGMGTASGGMMVDYANNVLWIPTRKATGLGGGTLWAFSTLTGLQLGVLDLGDSDYGVNLDFRSNQLYFTANGTSPARVVAVDVNTRTEAWRFNLPATPTTWVFPTGNGFIASLSNGTVARYAVVNNAVVSTPVWTRNVAGPTGITIDYGTQKIYVGSNDGNVYELATADGAVTGQARVSTSGGVGTPTLDSTAGRLHVGTMDGRVCAFRVPF